MDKQVLGGWISSRIFAGFPSMLWFHVRVAFLNERRVEAVDLIMPALLSQGCIIIFNPQTQEAKESVQLWHRATIIIVNLDSGWVGWKLQLFFFYKYEAPYEE